VQTGTYLAPHSFKTGGVARPAAALEVKS